MEIIENKYGDKIEKLGDGLYGIDDAKNQSFYLIEGEEKALVVDTGMQGRPLTPVLKELTKLPMVLALTHAHPDHMYHADEFETVYLGDKDIEAWDKWLRRIMWVFEKMSKLPAKKFNVNTYLPVTEETVIDLGGNQIEVIAVPGHTPGSVLYVDHKHKSIFIGDAVGSGMMVLMALPGSLCLSKYEKSLEALTEKLKGLEDYKTYGGHRNQERGAGERGADYYNPVTPAVVEDMRTLCVKLLDGSLKPEGKGFLSAAFGKAEIQFRKSQLR